MSTPIERIRRYHNELRDLRRDLHAHPELAFEETRTSGLVAERLAACGVEVHRGLAKTGVVGIVRGRGTGSGRAIALRADMDCLPMHETANIPHLGAARYLAETREFDGTVCFIFQPAEEGGGGAQVMLREGLFERFPVNEVYGLHNWPGLPPGKMAVRAGPVMAATDEVQITVRGRGGHGAMPHLAVDPVVVSAQLITALQTIASRSVNPIDAVVVSICSMATSQVGVFNVIPDHVKLVGTVRTFQPQTRDLAERRVRELATKTAEAFGASAEVTYARGYPATINSPREARFAADVGKRVFGAENVITEHEPTMGGEDFAYFLQERPGAYVFLGQGGAAGGCLLHNPNYDFNDEVIPLGAGYLAALAEEALPLK